MPDRVPETWVSSFGSACRIEMGLHKKWEKYEETHFQLLNPFIHAAQLAIFVGSTSQHAPAKLPKTNYLGNLAGACWLIDPTKIDVIF